MGTTGCVASVMADAGVVVPRDALFVPPRASSPTAACSADLGCGI